MSREAMKLALEALEGSIALTMPKIDLRKEAIAALREALAQPARKPLTVEQIEEVWMAYKKARPKNSSNHESRLQFARAIEAAHGIKEAS